MTDRRLGDRSFVRERDDELFKAVERRDVERVRAVLAAGANVNAEHPDRAGTAPLCLACTPLDAPVDMTLVRLLLEHGASLCGYYHDAGPLQSPALGGNIELLAFLLEYGGVDSETSSSALSLACTSGYIRDHTTREAVIDLLLAHGARPDTFMRPSMTACTAADTIMFFRWHAAAERAKRSKERDSNHAGAEQAKRLKERFRDDGGSGRGGAEPSNLTASQATEAVAAALATPPIANVLVRPALQKLENAVGCDPTAMITAARFLLRSLMTQPSDEGLFVAAELARSTARHLINALLPSHHPLWGELATTLVSHVQRALDIFGAFLIDLWEQPEQSEGRTVVLFYRELSDENARQLRRAHPFFGIARSALGTFEEPAVSAWTRVPATLAELQIPRSDKLGPASAKLDFLDCPGLRRLLSVPLDAPCVFLVPELPTAFELRVSGIVHAGQLYVMLAAALADRLSVLGVIAPPRAVLDAMTDGPTTLISASGSNYELQFDLEPWQSLDRSSTFHWNWQAWFDWGPPTIVAGKDPTDYALSTGFLIGESARLDGHLCFLVTGPAWRSGRTAPIEHTISHGRPFAALSATINSIRQLTQEETAHWLTRAQQCATTERTPAVFFGGLDPQNVDDADYPDAVSSAGDDDASEPTLLWACESGNLAMVDKLLADSGVANQRYDHESLLDIASLHGHLAVVERLISAGAVQNQDYSKAIRNACMEGYVKIADRLLVAAAGGRDFDAWFLVNDAVRFRFWDIVYDAVRFRLWDIVALLVRHGVADVGRLQWRGNETFWPLMVQGIPRTMFVHLPDTVRPTWFRFHWRLRYRLQRPLAEARDRLDRPPSRPLGTGTPTRAELIAHLRTAGRRFAREYWLVGIPIFFPSASLGPLPEEFTELAIQ